MTAPHPFYPVSLNLSGRRCLVVGAGHIGKRRVHGLLEAGAKVVVIDPNPQAEIRSLAREGLIEWRARPFESGDVQGCLLAFAATASAEVNRGVGEAAGEAGVLFCGMDAASGRDFEVAGVVRRGDLQITVSTAGSSPAFARLVRERLEGCFGEECGAFLAFLRDVRPRVLARFPDSPARRKDVWNRLVTWDTVALVRNGDWDRIEAHVKACLS